MIQLLSKGHKSLAPVELGELKRDPAALEEAIWIDLLMPSREEEEFVENHLDVEIPTKEEMHEIEASSRLFVEDKALYMSCWMLSYESPIPENTSVTFILSPKHLTSIRYSDHHAFRIFTSQRRTRQPRRFNSTNDALVELMDAVVEPDRQHPAPGGAEPQRALPRNILGAGLITGQGTFPRFEGGRPAPRQTELPREQPSRKLDEFSESRHVRA